jgi:hypothetical protein
VYTVSFCHLQVSDAPVCSIPVSREGKSGIPRGQFRCPGGRCSFAGTHRTQLTSGRLRTFRPPPRGVSSRCPARTQLFSRGHGTRPQPKQTQGGRRAARRVHARHSGRAAKKIEGIWRTRERRQIPSFHKIIATRQTNGASQPSLPKISHLGSVTFLLTDLLSIILRCMRCTLFISPFEAHDQKQADYEHGYYPIKIACNAGLQFFARITARRHFPARAGLFLSHQQLLQFAPSLPRRNIKKVSLHLFCAFFIPFSQLFTSIQDHVNRANALKTLSCSLRTELVSDSIMSLFHCQY